MSLPSWNLMAAKLNLTRCRGMTPAGQRCYENHLQGEVTLGNGKQDRMHWADRAVTRKGIKAFVTVVVEDRLEREHDEPHWHLQWRIFREVYRVTFDVLGVRLYRELFELDRAVLRAMLVNVPANAPDRDKAMLWAKQR